MRKVAFAFVAALLLMASFVVATPSLIVSVRAGEHDNSKDNGTNSTASPSPSNNTADCFPAVALVTLLDGTTKKMSDLVVGDQVAVGGGQYSEVFLFTHAESGMRTFVRAHTDSGSAFIASKGHYVYASGSLKAAAALVVGDQLTLADGSNTRVVDIDSVQLDGLYNPQTRHGDIVVDGFVASTYTTAADVRLAHAALSPLRMAFDRLGLVAYWDHAIAAFAADKLRTGGNSVVA